MPHYLVVVDTRDRVLAERILKFLSGDNKPENTDVRLDVVPSRGRKERRRIK